MRELEQPVPSRLSEVALAARTSLDALACPDLNISELIREVSRYDDGTHVVGPGLLDEQVEQLLRCFACLEGLLEDCLFRHFHLGGHGVMLCSTAEDWN